MKRSVFAAALVSVLAGGVVAPSAMGQASFMSYPANCMAREVSGDGSVVVGSYQGQAFRWTQSGGFSYLGSGIAWGVSGDGSAVAGSGSLGSVFRWTQPTGRVTLPLSLGTEIAISRDGSTVVSSNTRWNATTGLSSLPIPAGYTPNTFDAYDLSSDGSVVVGAFGYGQPVQPFRWTASGGTELLGHIPGGQDDSLASVVSGDGSQIAGIGRAASGYDTFRWTEQTGMVGLGVVTAGFGAPLPRDMTPDGSVLVGTAGFTTFVWSGSGPENLQDVLEQQFGLDLGGYQLLFANGVSDDGRTLVGIGLHPGGYNSGWIVHLPSAIPSPSGLAVLGCGLVACGRRRRAGSGVSRA